MPEGWFCWYLPLFRVALKGDRVSHWVDGGLGRKVSQLQGWPAVNFHCLGLSLCALSWRREPPVFPENPECRAAGSGVLIRSPAPGREMAVSCPGPQPGPACSGSWGLSFVKISRSLCQAGCFLASWLPSLWRFGNPAHSVVLANNLGNSSCLTGAPLALRWSGALRTHLEHWAGAPVFTREHPWGLTVVQYKVLPRQRKLL